MYQNIKLLNIQEDKNLKISPIKSFRYASESTQVIVTLDEFFQAAKSQPIVFGKDSSENYYAAALLGLKEKKNLFINGKGEWKSDAYIPAFIRRYPFIFIQDGENLALALDKDCKEVNEKKGELLFDDDGKASEYTNSVMDFMKNYQVSSQKTSAVIKVFNDLGLLEEANATMTVEGEPLTLKGFFRINEEKLDGLNDNDTLALVKSGAYKYLVAHLLSLSNFEKLITYTK